MSEGERADPPVRGRFGGVGRVVLLLGLTSFLTDVSSEMVTTSLPLFLLLSAGASPAQYGVVDGLQQGGASLMRLASGLVTDRRQRPKAVAAAGYGLSALSRVGLVVSSLTVPFVAVLVLVDRLGKGIRTPARDAMIAAAADPARRGAAFGVHRAMDTAGATLGPLIVAAILALSPDSYRTVFLVSAVFAVAGFGVIALLVDVPRASRGRAEQPSIRELVRLAATPGLRTLILLATVLALGTVGDTLLYVSLQQRVDLDPSRFPLLFVASSLTYAALAAPLGALSDRAGRVRVFGSGYALLAGIYVLLLAHLSGTLALLAIPALIGVFYAATDGVVTAFASDLVPAGARATGLAALATATGVARLVASAGFGAIWSLRGLDSALWSALAMLSVGVLTAAITIPRLQRGTHVLS